MFVTVRSLQGAQCGSLYSGEASAHPMFTRKLSLLSAIGQQNRRLHGECSFFMNSGTDSHYGERNRLARELHDAVTRPFFCQPHCRCHPPHWKRNPKEGLQNLEELRQMTRGALAEK